MITEFRQFVHEVVFDVKQYYVEERGSGNEVIPAEEKGGKSRIVDMGSSNLTLLSRNTVSYATWFLNNNNESTNYYLDFQIYI